MDTGKATFREDTLDKLKAEVASLGRAPGEEGIFQTGEIIVLKGSRFKVEKINKTHMILRLLKRA